MWFLIAFLFYNDGIQTTIFMATIYGKTELKLSETTLMITLLMIQFLAVGGAFFFSRLAEKKGTQFALTIALVIFCLAVISAGFISTAEQYYVLGAVIGLVLGGSQALSRSFYAGLVPPENSAEFFGYYSVVARLSAVGGPFLFALVSQATGSSRNSIFVIAAFFIAGIALLRRIRVA
jgi:UMF1 family MFS transporter